MNVKTSLLFRSAGLLAGSFLAASAVLAAEAAKAESDALTVGAENIIKISAQTTDFDGTRASSQARTQLPRNGAAGIESLNLTKELSKITTLQIDAKALPGSEDYLAQFRLTKNEVGSFEAGYKRFRTFYDGMGGFFPLNNAWLPIYTRALFVDRGKMFVNATINLPKSPVFTFRYTNETRSGRKDSTIWGDTDQTGVPISSVSALNLISANRKIVPAFIQLNERHEVWEAAMKNTVGKTSYSLAIVGDRINNLNTRSVDRYPGELKPFPAIPANPPTLVPALLANNENKGFDQQGMKQDGLTFTGKIETALNDQVSVYAQASHRSSDGNTTGSRLITAKIQTLTGLQSQVGAFTPAGRPPYSHNSTGDLDFEVLTGVVGLEARPKDFRISVAVKAEDYSSNAKSTANYVSNMVNQTTGVVTAVPLTGMNSSKIDEKVWTPEVDVRYTGIKNFALYGAWDFRSSPGDERLSYVGITTSTAGPVVLSAPVLVFDKVKEDHNNMKVGANWTVNSMLKLRGEVFTRDHENRFTGYASSLGGYYTLDYDIYGARLTADLKVSPTLKFTTRYVQQRGKAMIAEEGYLEGDSNDSKRYHIAETISWNPNKGFYLQANANVVFDKTSTAYPKAGGTANDVLRNADNNYWNGSVVAGWVVDKQTDAQVTGTYYRANNYNRAIATSTDPYGASGRDYALYVGVKHKFSERFLGHAKVGYADSRNDTTGGFTNYKGPLAYLAVEYGL